ncbi:hypothetical protein ACFYS7_34680 [Streptomyces avermitilis]|uniref:hypothetical protein n=1 Tax=Streptomyces avermitilis TaxID=33903 RepID=UPI0036A9F3AB
MLRFAVGQAYLWCDGDELTLIDAGTVGSAASIVQALTGIGRRPEDVAVVVRGGPSWCSVGRAAHRPGR